MFRFLDEAGTDGKTAAAHVVLGNDEQITVRAGGPGIHSWPASGPYEQYEVLTDGVTPRFWHRYGDAAGVLYAKVPRLLVTHHIIRCGGVRDLFCETSTRKVLQDVDIRIRTDKATSANVLRSLRSLVGVELVSALFSPDVLV